MIQTETTLDAGIPALKGQCQIIFGCFQVTNDLLGRKSQLTMHSDSSSFYYTEH